MRCGDRPQGAERKTGARGLRSILEACCSTPCTTAVAGERQQGGVDEGVITAATKPS
jgi:ATP-dependent protease Clp ATPase subunit